MNMYQWLSEKLGRPDKGVAAIEFAIVLPVLLLTFIGLYDASSLIYSNNKMNRMAQDVNNMVTRGGNSTNPLTAAQLDTILQNAPPLIALPFTFPGTTGKVIVTCVYQQAAPPLAPIIPWSDSSSGPLVVGKTTGSKINAASLPGGLTLSVGQSVIFTEVFFTYQPLIPGYVIEANKPIYALAAAVPRQGSMATPPQ